MTLVAITAWPGCTGRQQRKQLIKEVTSMYVLLQVNTYIQMCFDLQHKYNTFQFPFKLLNTHCCTSGLTHHTSHTILSSPTWKPSFLHHQYSLTLPLSLGSLTTCPSPPPSLSPGSFPPGHLLWEPPQQSSNLLLESLLTPFLSQYMCSSHQ